MMTFLNDFLREKLLSIILNMIMFCGGLSSSPESTGYVVFNFLILIK